MTDCVLLEVQDGIGWLTLNRPDRANAITTELVDRLQDLAWQASQDTDVRVIVVTGSGRHFCAGADLTEATVPALERMLRHPNGLSLDWTPKPVIAAINGSAMGGGCEIALACDFRIMAERAKIGLTEIRFGALPAAGGCIRAPRIVGQAAAKRLIMLGDPIDAAEALRIGLVDEVCPGDELMDRVKALAQRLAARPAYALRAAKQLINLSLDVDVATGLRLERTLIAKMGTPEELQAARDAAAAESATYARIFSGERRS